jgi:3-methyladenine DNA glycosylase AlkD
MLKAIPRQSYADWVKTCSGAWNHFGEDATAIIAKHWPEEAPGEYAAKFKDRETRIGIGSVVMVAKEDMLKMLEALIIAEQELADANRRLNMALGQ